MTNLRDELAVLQHLKEQRDQAEHALDLARRVLKDQIEGTLQQELEKLPCYVNTIVASSADTVFVYYAGLDDPTYMLKDGWAKQDPLGGPNAGIPTQNGPMPWKDFLAFWHEFEEKTGIKVEFSTLERKENPDPNNIHYFRDIERLHPGQKVEFLEQGKVWHTGWDIPDRFLIVKIDGTRWAWWSTDAHGGPLTHSAMEGTPEYDTFETFRKKGPKSPHG